MKWLALVCALAACDQVFGLHPTGSDRSLDARYFDAPIDAPYACPAIGTPPQFLGSLREQLSQNCRSYSRSAAGSPDHAMAWCDENAAFDGPSDGPLTMTNIVLDNTGQELTSILLAPEGDHAIASIYDANASMFYIELFQHTSDGAWHDVHSVITFPAALTIVYPLVSTPSREPNAHVLVLDVVYPNPPILYELVDDGNPDPSQPWRQESMQSVPSTLDIVDGMSMTPDGLRLVFLSEASDTGIFYEDRASIDAAFSAPTQLANVPQTPGTDPFMTEDCSYLYVSGLGAVFYATQLPPGSD